jgi:lysophospholipase L1-like esterase
VVGSSSDVPAPAQTNLQPSKALLDTNSSHAASNPNSDTPAHEHSVPPSTSAFDSERPAPAPQAARRECNLLAAGDSLTDPRSGGGGYLDLAVRACHCRVTNLGKGGAMVNQMRKRFVAQLEGTHELYTHAVIFGGVNDLYSDLTAKRTVRKINADLEAMYQASKARGLNVVAITVAPWGGFKRYFSQHRWANTLEVNAWIRASTSRGLSDAVIDAEHLLACGDAQRICESYAVPYRDGLHFGPKGHHQIALALVRALGAAYCTGLPDAGSE